MLIDRINATRGIAATGDPDRAERELLALQPELFTESERGGWRRAWRAVQEMKQADFYGRH